jgi:hypothetical protein
VSAQDQVITTRVDQYCLEQIDEACEWIGCTREELFMEAVMSTVPQITDEANLTGKRMRDYSDSVRDSIIHRRHQEAASKGDLVTTPTPKAKPEAPLSHNLSLKEHTELTCGLFNLRGLVLGFYYWIESPHQIEPGDLNGIANIAEDAIERLLEVLGEPVE